MSDIQIGKEQYIIRDWCLYYRVHLMAATRMDEKQYVKPSKMRKNGRVYWEDLVSLEQCLEELRTLLPPPESKPEPQPENGWPVVEETDSEFLHNLLNRLHCAGHITDEQANRLIGIAESMAENGWRPIDSAPKDGSEVLVFCRSGRRAVAACDERFHDWFVPEGNCLSVVRIQPREDLYVSAMSTKDAQGLQMAAHPERPDPMSSEPKKLVALMKHKADGSIIWNQYNCAACKAAGVNHQVIDVPSLPTDRHSDWGAGLPTTMRHCTNCGAEDGPWVSAELVGGGW